MMKDINIGLIGFGTIGTGVVKLLRQNEELITKKLGARVVLKKIADIDITTSREIKVNKGLLTNFRRRKKMPWISVLKPVWVELFQ